MPAYREMAGRPWSDTLELCTIATLGDVLFTVLIYGVGALAAGDVRWGISGKWNVYATAALLGAAVASVVEWRALNEADTCRKLVRSRLDAAGWDSPPRT